MASAGLFSADHASEAAIQEWLKNAPAALLEQLRGGATGTQCAKKLTLALRSAVVEPEPEVSAADEPEIKDFYSVGRAKATEAEVHLFALFIIGLGHTDSDIRTWASSVADGYGAEFDLLKNTWRPPTAKGEVAAWSKLALVMAKAVKVAKPRLPLCAEAMAKILGIDTPSMSALNRWLDGVRRVPKRVPLEAPADPKAKNGNLRYIYEMVPVARLLRLKLNTLRREYDSASGKLPDDIKMMTKAQVIEHANALEAAAITMKLGQDAANKKAKRWQEKAEKTVPVIRAEEQAKFAVKKARLTDKVEELARAQAAQLLAEKDIKIAKQAVYLSVARKDRRDLSGQLTTATATSKARHDKLVTAHLTIDNLKAQTEQYKERAEELEVELSASQSSVSSVSTETLDAICAGRGLDGQFGAHCWQMRVVIWGQLARRCPPSSIAGNIVESLRLAVPDIKPVMPSMPMIRRMRGELTIAGETIAAIRIATCRRVLSFGFDESTKKQVSLLSTNVQIEDEHGKTVNVVPRGSSVLCGGTGEKVAEGVRRLFAHLQRLLEELRDGYETRFGKGSYTGPDATNIGMHLLAENCILMTDTCTTARKTSRLVKDMITEAVKGALGNEAWEALTDEQKEHKNGALSGHCWQHMRNIFLDAMTAACNEFLEFTLGEWLEEFVPQERMSPDIMQIIRAVYKEFHHGGHYYKGKGKEFEHWRVDNHPTTRWLKLERAEGGRQDLAFDGAVPIFVGRPLMLEFLRDSVHLPDKKNTLEDFIWTVLSSREVVASLRVYALYDLLLSRQMRWLSGKGATLPGFSTYKMGEVFDGVEAALIAIAEDGNVLFQPDTDFFTGIAAEQPQFRAWRDAFFHQEIASVPDNKGAVKHKVYQWVLDEARAPTDDTYTEGHETAVEIAQLMANAALAKFHDPNLALSQWLESQDGENAFAKRQTEHVATVGANITNDTVESNFGTYDANLKIFGTAAPENLSGMAQQARSKDFHQGNFVRSDRRKRKVAEDELGANVGADASDIGFFNTLPAEMKEAIVTVARKNRKASRDQAKKDWDEQLAYRRERRQDNLVTALNAAVQRYANALELYDAWKAHGVPNMATVTAKLRGKSEAAKLLYLRNEIEMRVIGCGWVQFDMRWSSLTDETVGSVASLTILLKDILIYEAKCRDTNDLPTEAAVPQQRFRKMKELGNMAADAAAIRGKSVFDESELLGKAEAERQRRIAAGISDDVEDNQPAEAPAWSELVGRCIEVCWPYYTPDGKRQLIWTEGKVTEIADGITTKRTAASRAILPAGAVYWEWEADKERNEVAGADFLILNPGKWSPARAVANAWRYSPSELRRLAVEKAKPSSSESGTARRDAPEAPDDVPAPQRRRHS